MAHFKYIGRSKQGERAEGVVESNDRAGAVDEHWEEGKAEHLQAVLDAVVAGLPAPFTTKPRSYGCEFSVPASCLADSSPVAGADPGS